MRSYYGVAVNGKMYVMGGWSRRQGRRLRTTSTTRPPTNGSEKKPMPRPAHHAALAALNGKIYVFGGFVRPNQHHASRSAPHGNPLTTCGSTTRLAIPGSRWRRCSTRRGSALASEVGGKIYVMGGATTVEASKDSFFTAFGPAKVLTTNEVYDPATNKWESRTPMTVARNHAYRRRRQRQDLRHRRPHRPRLHPERHQHGCGGGVQSRVRLVECSERSDAVCPKRRGLGYGRQVDLCGGRRGDDQRRRRRV